LISTMLLEERKRRMRKGGESDDLQSLV
jgi:hypothetical protein